VNQIGRKNASKTTVNHAAALFLSRAPSPSSVAVAAAFGNRIARPLVLAGNDANISEGDPVEIDTARPDCAPGPRQMPHAKGA
jgi:hypothetical protein